VRLLTRTACRLPLHSPSTEFYLEGSGVVAVVAYALYGANSYQYGFSSKGLRTGAFWRFYDVLALMLNGMVFFFVGASLVNFCLRWVVGGFLVPLGWPQQRARTPPLPPLPPSTHLLALQCG
jgi:hypothetical protein